MIGPTAALLVAVFVLLVLSQPHRTPAAAPDVLATQTTVALGAAATTAGTTVGEPTDATTGSAPPTLTTTLASPTVSPVAGALGETMRVFDGGVSVGTVTVVEMDPFAMGQTERVEIRVRYIAGAAGWPIDPGAWDGTSADGSVFSAYTGGRSPALRATTLAAHGSFEAWFEVDFPSAAREPLLTYAATDGTILFTVPLP